MKNKIKKEISLQRKKNDPLYWDMKKKYQTVIVHDEEDFSITRIINIEIK